MKQGKLTGEKAVNLFLLLLSAFYLAYSLTHYNVGTVRMPKEGFMPMLLGVGAVTVSAYLTLQAFLNKGDAKNVRFAISWPRFFAMVAVSLLYALTLETVGYLLATCLFLLAILKLADLKGWLKPVLIAVITSAAFYLIFKTALGVMLPAGFLGL